MSMASEREKFDQALLAAGIADGFRLYDADRGLVQIEAPYNPIHTNIKSGLAHPTRQSATFALLLLESRTDVDTAHRILREVLAGQDRDPGSKTYGLWGYYAEEPAARMSPPDWNWADFLGKVLLHVALRHADRLPPDLLDEVHIAIRHAAASVVRRNVPMNYTNIAAKGSFVTLATAELFGDNELLAYAVKRLHRFAAEIDISGSFSEYNSPTYWHILISAVSLMRMYARNDEARELVERIHERAWLHLVEHWHPPTMQQAGPMSRCYVTDLRGNILVQATLQKATGGAVRFLDKVPEVLFVGEEALIDYQAPDWAVPRLLELPAPREHRELFTLGTDSTAPAVGTAWLGFAVTLGSQNHGNTWLQRRPLVGYWRRPADPVVPPGRYVQARIMKDDFDFASGMVSCVQSGGAVAWIAGFVSPGGDQHVHLDAIDAGVPFTARSLRLAFDIVGAGEAVQAGPVKLGEALILDLDGATLAFTLAGGQCGENPVTARIVRDGTSARIEVVFVESDEPVEIDWTSLHTVFAAGVLTLAVEPGPALTAPVLEVADDIASLTWQAPAWVGDHPDPDATRELVVRASAAVVNVAGHAAAFGSTVDGHEPPAPRLSDQRLVS